jgi:alpha-beta hydrolase superfamily lysophospholipase
MPTRFSEFSFRSSDGKSRVAGFIWAPENQPSGVVQLCHGMNEYIGRYSDFAEFLCSRGYVVCGHDHIGHGHTALSDTDLGHIPRRGGGNILVEDLHTVTTIIKEKYPGLPVFLLGHRARQAALPGNRAVPGQQGKVKTDKQPCFRLIFKKG